MKYKVLIIGATGGIGSELIKLFPDKYEVTGVGSKELKLPFTVNNYLQSDIVINLAAVYDEGVLSHYSLLSKRLIEVNCWGVVNLLGDFLPEMQKRGYGRIILFSSIYSHINVPGMGVYSASKAFVDKITKIAAIENGKHGITVNSIQLGYTGLGMGFSSEENMKRAKEKTALKRFVKVDEIYQTIEYLINCEYITGQNIKLDGGIR